MQLVRDRTDGRTFVGVRVGDWYGGVVIRRYRFDTRIFLVLGGSTTPLLQWRKR